MRRREFLTTLTAAAALPAARQDRAPNVIFILADDLGWADTGAYGHAQIKTPNIDKLARQGKLFTQFYANAPVCSPSWCAFMTGHFPARHGIHSAFINPKVNKERGQVDFLDPKVPLLPGLLRPAGYRTAHFGKWHLGEGPGAPDPGAYGIDVHRTVNSNGPGWEDERDPYFRARSTTLIVDEAVRFMEQNRDRPFYLNAWPLLPHATLNPTEEQMKPYERFGPGHGIPHKGALQVYYASVTALDEQIGRLLSKVDELGLTGNTIVAFSSDNGPEDIHLAEASHSGAGSTGPFRGRKRSLYEGGIRMPFIVRWPGHVSAGEVDNQSVVAGVDFLPTVGRLTGAKLPDGLSLDGEDRSDAILGKPRPRTRPLLWEWRLSITGDIVNRSPMLAIRDGDWKLLLNPGRSRVELYDIPRDPTELNNLAPGKPEIVNRLAARALAWQATLPKGPLHPLAGSNDYPWPKPAR